MMSGLLRRISNRWLYLAGALYASGLTSAEPGLCVLFCSKNIPSEANDIPNRRKKWL